MDIKYADMTASPGGLIKLTTVISGSKELIAEDITAINAHPDEWELIVRKKKKARSLDANGYLWELIDRIAAKIKSDKVTVYKELIRGTPGVSTIVCVQEKAKAAFIDEWTKRGVGWQVEEMPSKIQGCVNLICYYGSSTYDTKQMSALIDRAIDECKELHISTLTPLEIDKLKREYR